MSRRAPDPFRRPSPNRGAPARDPCAIRAPRIESHGDAVEVLASVEGHPVAVRQGQVVLCAFHPELTDDSRMHALLMALATAARERRGDRETGVGQERDA